jgi:hypothetical protein
VTSTDFTHLFSLTAVCVASTLLPMPFLSLLPPSLDRDAPGDKKDEGPGEEEMALLERMEGQPGAAGAQPAAAAAPEGWGPTPRAGGARQPGGGGGGGGGSGE